jgi:ketosteroid isomerase-like protein
MDDVEVVKRFLGALRERQTIRLMRLTTRDLLLSLPADSPKLGGQEHRGRMTAARAMGRLLRLSGDTLSVEPESFNAEGGGRVTVPGRVTARRGRERLDHQITFYFLVRKGRVAEIRETAHDLDAWHAFWD